MMPVQIPIEEAVVLSRFSRFITALLAATLLTLVAPWVVSAAPVTPAKRAAKLSQRLSVEAQRVRSPNILTPSYSFATGQMTSKGKRVLTFHISSCPGTAPGRADDVMLRISASGGMIHYCDTAVGHWAKYPYSPFGEATVLAAWKRMQATISSLSGCMRHGQATKTGCPHRSLSTSLRLEGTAGELGWDGCKHCGLRDLKLTLPAVPATTRYTRQVATNEGITLFTATPMVVRYGDSTTVEYRANALSCEVWRDKELIGSGLADPNTGVVYGGGVITSIIDTTVFRILCKSSNGTNFARELVVTVAPPQSNTPPSPPPPTPDILVTHSGTPGVPDSAPAPLPSAATDATPTRPWVFITYASGKTKGYTPPGF